MKKRILFVTYDQSLLVTRQAILKNGGYEVFSARDQASALETCDVQRPFDLVMMGNSMPQTDKSALFAALRPKCNAPLLTIRRHGESPLPEANCSIEAPTYPPALLTAVEQTLVLSALDRIADRAERIRALEERIKELQRRMLVAQSDDVLEVAKELTDTLDALARAKTRTQ